MRQKKFTLKAYPKEENFFVNFLRTFRKTPLSLFKKRLPLRGISLALALVFTAESAVWAAPDALSLRSVSSPSAGVSGIEIPESLGTLQSRYIPENAAPDSPFIIHIQDAHAQPEAQRNTQALLNYLARNQKIQRIALEGAFGKWDSRPFQFFRDPQANRVMADRLVEMGEWTGAELFTMDPQNTQIELFGVEDKALYAESFRTFRQVKSGKKETAAILREYEQTLEQTEARIFSKDLWKWMQKKKAWDEKKDEALDYFRVLREMASRYLKLDLGDASNQFEWPNLTRLLKAEEMEARFNRETAAAQIRELIVILRAKPDPKGLLRRGSGKEILRSAQDDKRHHFILEGLNLLGDSSKPFEPWLSANTAFPQIKTARRFFELLYEESQSRQIALLNYPDFLALGGLLILREEIDSSVLLKELKIIEPKLEEAMACSEQEKKLLQTANDFSLLKKIVSLEMSREEYEIYTVRKKEISGYYSRTAKMLTLAEKFYALSRKRDQVLIQNTLKNTAKGKATVLIAGGFHSEGLTALLKTSKIPHMVIAPKMTHFANDNLYEKVMMGENGNRENFKAAGDKLPRALLRELLADPRLLNELEISRTSLQTVLDTSMAGLDAAYSSTFYKDHPGLFAGTRAPSESEIQFTTRSEMRMGPKSQVDRKTFLAPSEIEDTLAAAVSRLQTLKMLSKPVPGRKTPEKQKQLEDIAARRITTEKERQILETRLQEGITLKFRDYVAYMKGFLERIDRKIRESERDKDVHALYKKVRAWIVTAEVKIEEKPGSVLVIKIPGIPAKQLSSPDSSPDANPEKELADFLNGLAAGNKIKLLTKVWEEGGIVYFKDFDEGMSIYRPDVLEQILKVTVKFPDKDSKSEVRLTLTKEQSELLDQAAEVYHLSPADKLYLKGLWMQQLARMKGIEDPNKKALHIAPDAKSVQSGENFILGSHLSAADREKLLGAYEYLKLVSPEYARAAQDVIVTANSMDGGIGENLARALWLGKRLAESGVQAGEVKLGAKGTDLGYDITIAGKKVFVSIAEAKILQLIKTSEQNQYAGIKFQPLVNHQSLKSYEDLLASPYLYDRLQGVTKPRTLWEAMMQNGIEILPLLQQADLPRISLKSGNITLNEKVKRQPGGHGQWGVLFMYESLTAQIPDDGKTRIRAFYNGDNLNSGLNENIIGFMAQNKIPIIKLTTAAAPIDKKGGKDGVRIVIQDGKTYFVPDQMEVADAKSAGQQPFFEEAGQEGGNGEAGKQPFNTNVIYINDSVLSPILKDLQAAVGEDSFAAIISPTLLDQTAKAIEIAGEKFIPLDGAIGNVIHNLNSFFMLNQDDPQIKAISDKHGLKDGRLLYFVDVPRTKFFTPVKVATDMWLQAYSDYYKFNPANMKLEDSRPGLTPPEFDLTSKGADGKDDKHWLEVQNLVDAFGHASAVDLKSLTIEGKVFLKDAKLAGHVKIVNPTGKAVDLNDPALRITLQSLLKDGRLTLSNVEIIFSADGTVSINRYVDSNAFRESLDSLYPRIRNFQWFTYLGFVVGGLLLGIAFFTAQWTPAILGIVSGAVFVRVFGGLSDYARNELKQQLEKSEVVLVESKVSEAEAQKIAGRLKALKFSRNTQQGRYASPSEIKWDVFYESIQKEVLIYPAGMVPPGIVWRSEVRTAEPDYADESKTMKDILPFFVQRAEKIKELLGLDIDGGFPYPNQDFGRIVANAFDIGLPEVIRLLQANVRNQGDRVAVPIGIRDSVRETLVKIQTGLDQSKPRWQKQRGVKIQHSQLMNAYDQIGEMIQRIDALVKARSEARKIPVSTTNMTREEEIATLRFFLDELKKEQKDPGSGLVPVVSVISDPHGGIDKFDALLVDSIRQALPGVLPADFKLDPDRPLEEQLSEAGIGMDDLHGKVYFHNLGDLMDRGAYGIKVFRRSMQLIKAGLADFVIGNHDLWPMMNLWGMHLPWYDGFNFYDYSDDYDKGNNEMKIDRLVRAYHKRDPQTRTKSWWAQKLYKFTRFHENEQKERWNKLDIEFNGELDPKGKRVNSTGLYAQLDQKELTAAQKAAWDKFRGWYDKGDIEVYTGIRAVGLVSVKWWKELLTEFEKAYAGSPHAPPVERALQLMKQEILPTLKTQLQEQLNAGEWWVRAFEAINSKNYTSVEWWTKDWAYHKDWGTAVIEEINDELQSPDVRLALASESDEEKRKALRKDFQKQGRYQVYVNQGNYLDNATLQQVAEDYRDLFNLHNRDIYQTDYMHAFLPIDMETGEYFFTYQGTEYRGKGDEKHPSVWKGLAQIGEDIRNRARTPRDLYKALSLINSWYADNTTKAKVPDVVNALEKFGADHLAGVNGISHLLFTGHLPFHEFLKYKKEGGPITGFLLGGRFGIADHGMEKRFGSRGASVLISPNGVELRGFEHAEHQEIISSPRTVKIENDGLETVLFENKGIPREVFLPQLIKEVQIRLAELHAPSLVTEVPVFRYNAKVNPLIVQEPVRMAINLGHFLVDEESGERTRILASNFAGKSKIAVNTVQNRIFDTYLREITGDPNISLTDIYGVKSIDDLMIAIQGQLHGRPVNTRFQLMEQEGQMQLVINGDGSGKEHRIRIHQHVPAAEALKSAGTQYLIDFSDPELTGELAVKKRTGRDLREERLKALQQEAGLQKVFAFGDEDPAAATVIAAINSAEKTKEKNGYMPLASPITLAVEQMKHVVNTQFPGEFDFAAGILAARPVTGDGGHIKFLPPGDRGGASVVEYAIEKGASSAFISFIPTKNSRFKTIAQRLYAEIKAVKKKELSPKEREKETEKIKKKFIYENFNSLIERATHGLFGRYLRYAGEENLNSLTAMRERYSVVFDSQATTIRENGQVDLYFHFTDFGYAYSLNQIVHEAVQHDGKPAVDSERRKFEDALARGVWKEKTIPPDDVPQIKKVVKPGDEIKFGIVGARGRIGAALHQDLLSDPNFLPVFYLGIEDIQTVLHQYREDVGQGSRDIERPEGFYIPEAAKDGKIRLRAKKNGQYLLNPQTGEPLEIPYFHIRQRAGEEDETFERRMRETLGPLIDEIEVLANASGFAMDSKDKFYNPFIEGKNLSLVWFTAPAKGDADITLIRGVNEDDAVKKVEEALKILFCSGASCTTTALGRVLVEYEKFLENWGVEVIDFEVQPNLEMEFASFISHHGITPSQGSPFGDPSAGKSLRGANGPIKAANLESTGADKVVKEVVPSLKGRSGGVSHRDGNFTGSAVDIRATLRSKSGKYPTAEDINDHFKKLAGTKEMEGILKYLPVLLSTAQIAGEKTASIFAANGTRVDTGRQSSVATIRVGYDNEGGYTPSQTHLIKLMALARRKLATPGNIQIASSGEPAYFEEFREFTAALGIRIKQYAAYTAQDLGLNPDDFQAYREDLKVLIRPVLALRTSSETSLVLTVLDQTASNIAALAAENGSTPQLNDVAEDLRNSHAELNEKANGESFKNARSEVRQALRMLAVDDSSESSRSEVRDAEAGQNIERLLEWMKDKGLQEISGVNVQILKQYQFSPFSDLTNDEIRGNDRIRIFGRPESIAALGEDNLAPAFLLDTKKAVFSVIKLNKALELDRMPKGPYPVSQETRILIDGRGNLQLWNDSDYSVTTINGSIDAEERSMTAPERMKIDMDQPGVAEALQPYQEFFESIQRYFHFSYKNRNEKNRYALLRQIFDETGYKNKEDFLIRFLGEAAFDPGPDDTRAAYFEVLEKALASLKTVDYGKVTAKIKLILKEMWEGEFKQSDQLYYDAEAAARVLALMPDERAYQMLLDIEEKGVSILGRMALEKMDEWLMAKIMDMRAGEQLRTDWLKRLEALKLKRSRVSPEVLKIFAGDGNSFLLQKIWEENTPRPSTLVKSAFFYPYGVPDRRKLFNARLTEWDALKKIAGPEIFKKLVDHWGFSFVSRLAGQKNLEQKRDLLAQMAHSTPSIQWAREFTPVQQFFKHLVESRQESVLREALLLATNVDLKAMTWELVGLIKKNPAKYTFLMTFLINALSLNPPVIPESESPNARTAISELLKGATPETYYLVTKLAEKIPHPGFASDPILIREPSGYLDDKTGNRHPLFLWLRIKIHREPDSHDFEMTGRILEILLGLTVSNERKRLKPERAAEMLKAVVPGKWFERMKPGLNDPLSLRIGQMLWKAAGPTVAQLPAAYIEQLLKPGYEWNHPALSRLDPEAYDYAEKLIQLYRNLQARYHSSYSEDLKKEYSQDGDVLTSIKKIQEREQANKAHILTYQEPEDYTPPIQWSYLVNHLAGPPEWGLMGNVGVWPQYSEPRYNNFEQNRALGTLQENFFDQFLNEDFEKMEIDLYRIFKRNQFSPGVDVLPEEARVIFEKLLEVAGLIVDKMTLDGLELGRLAVLKDWLRRDSLTLEQISNFLTLMEEESTRIYHFYNSTFAESAAEIALYYGKGGLQERYSSVENRIKLSDVQRAQRVRDLLLADLKAGDRSIVLLEQLIEKMQILLGNLKKEHTRLRIRPEVISDRLITSRNFDPQRHSPVAMGFKAFNELTDARAGLPVPPLVNLTTQVARDFHLTAEQGFDAIRNPAFRKLVLEAILQLEAETGKFFYFDYSRMTRQEKKRIRESREKHHIAPKSAEMLFFSVRSGSFYSMPGLMDTILNLPSNPKIIEEMIKRGYRGGFVYDTARRFVDSFGQSYGIDSGGFARIVDHLKWQIARGRPGQDPKKMVITEFSQKDLEELYGLFRRFVEGRLEKQNGNTDFITGDPFVQVLKAVIQVYRSWDSGGAKIFRKIFDVSDDFGTSVTFQQMVFGNSSPVSGTAVVFTQGAGKPPVGYAKFDSQGDDIVGGRTRHYLAFSREEGKASLEEVDPRIYQKIMRTIAVQVQQKYPGSDWDLEITWDNNITDDDGLPRIFLLQRRPFISTRGQNQKKLVAPPDARESGIQNAVLGLGKGVSSNAAVGRILDGAIPYEELERLVHQLRIDMDAAGEEDLDIILAFPDHGTVENGESPRPSYVTNDDLEKFMLPEVKGLIGSGGEGTHPIGIANLLNGEKGFAYVTNVPMELNDQSKVLRIGDQLFEGYGMKGPVVSIDGYSFQESVTSGHVFLGAVNIHHDVHLATRKNPLKLEPAVPVRSELRAGLPKVKIEVAIEITQVQTFETAVQTGLQKLKLEGISPLEHAGDAIYEHGKPVQPFTIKSLASYRTSKTSAPSVLKVTYELRPEQIPFDLPGVGAAIAQLSGQLHHEPVKYIAANSIEKTPAQLQPALPPGTLFYFKNAMNGLPQLLVLTKEEKRQFTVDNKPELHAAIIFKSPFKGPQELVVRKSEFVQQVKNSNVELLSPKTEKEIQAELTASATHRLQQMQLADALVSLARFLKSRFKELPPDALLPGLLKSLLEAQDAKMLPRVKVELTPMNEAATDFQLEFKITGKRVTQLQKDQESFRLLRDRITADLKDEKGHFRKDKAAEINKGLELNARILGLVSQVPELASMRSEVRGLEGARGNGKTPSAFQSIAVTDNVDYLLDQLKADLETLPSSMVFYAKKVVSLQEYLSPDLIKIELRFVSSKETTPVSASTEAVQELQEKFRQLIAEAVPAGETPRIQIVRHDTPRENGVVLPYYYMIKLNAGEAPIALPILRSETRATAEEIIQDIRVLLDELKIAGTENLDLLDSIKLRAELLRPRLLELYAGLSEDFRSKLNITKEKDLLQIVSTIQTIFDQKNKLVRAFLDKEYELDTQIQVLYFTQGYFPPKIQALSQDFASLAAFWKGLSVEKPGELISEKDFLKEMIEQIERLKSGHAGLYQEILKVDFVREANAQLAEKEIEALDSIVNRFPRNGPNDYSVEIEALLTVLYGGDIQYYSTKPGQEGQKDVWIQHRYDRLSGANQFLSGDKGRLKESQAAKMSELAQAAKKRLLELGIRADHEIPGSNGKTIGLILSRDPEYQHPFLHTFLGKNEELKGITSALSRIERAIDTGGFSKVDEALLRRFDNIIQPRIEMNGVSPYVNRIQHNKARGPYKGGERFTFANNLEEEELFMERFRDLVSKGLNLQELRYFLRKWLREETQALAFGMTNKSAVANLPYGGAKGSILFADIFDENGQKVIRDLFTGTKEEIKVQKSILIRKTSRVLYQAGKIGPFLDIPAPDFGSGPEDMNQMTDEVLAVIYEEAKAKDESLPGWPEDLKAKFAAIPRNTRESLLGAPFLEAVTKAVNEAMNEFKENVHQTKDPLTPVLKELSQARATFTAKSYETKKSPDLGGLEFRGPATGHGGVFVLEKVLEKEGKGLLAGKTAKIVGFGNVGGSAVERLIQAGALVQLISQGPVFGVVYKETGFSLADFKKLTDMRNFNHLNREEKWNIPGAVLISEEEFLRRPTDIHNLAFKENQVHKGNVAKMNSEIYLELANGPVTNEAYDEFLKAGAIVIPDTLGNPGGVIVSSFEWEQNLQGVKWTTEQAIERLELMLTEAVDRVDEIRTKSGTDWRTAADTLAIGEILEASRSPEVGLKNLLETAQKIKENNGNGVFEKLAMTQAFFAGLPPKIFAPFSSRMTSLVKASPHHGAAYQQAFRDLQKFYMELPLANRQAEFENTLEGRSSLQAYFQALSRAILEDASGRAEVRTAPAAELEQIYHQARQEAAASGRDLEIMNGVARLFAAGFVDAGLVLASSRFKAYASYEFGPAEAAARMIESMIPESTRGILAGVQSRQADSNQKFSVSEKSSPTVFLVSHQGELPEVSPEDLQALVARGGKIILAGSGFTPEAKGKYTKMVAELRRKNSSIRVEIKLNSMKALTVKALKGLLDSEDAREVAVLLPSGTGKAELAELELIPMKSGQKGFVTSLPQNRTARSTMVSLLGRLLLKPEEINELSLRELEIGFKENRLTSLYVPRRAEASFAFAGALALQRLFASAA